MCLRHAFLKSVIFQLLNVQLYTILSWEPSSAKVTKRQGSLASIDKLVLLRRCITPAVYPHLNDFTGKLNFLY